MTGLGQPGQLRVMRSGKNRGTAGDGAGRRASFRCRSGEEGEGGEAVLRGEKLGLVFLFSLFAALPRRGSSSLSLSPSPSALPPTPISTHHHPDLFSFSLTPVALVLSLFPSLPLSLSPQVAYSHSQGIYTRATNTEA